MVWKGSWPCLQSSLHKCLANYNILLRKETGDLFEAQILKGQSTKFLERLSTHSCRSGVMNSELQRLWSPCILYFIKLKCLLLTKFCPTLSVSILGNTILCLWNLIVKKIFSWSLLDFMVKQKPVNRSSLAPVHRVAMTVQQSWCTLITPSPSAADQYSGNTTFIAKLNYCHNCSEALGNVDGKQTWYLGILQKAQNNHSKQGKLPHISHEKLNITSLLF